MQPIEANENNTKNYFSCERILRVLPALCAIFVLARILKYSNYGIDFTDEGFYLTWISNPFLYDVSVTQFGYVYHPLYLMLGGDVASLRQANILITFGLSWCLVLLLLKSLVSEGSTQKITLNIVAAGFATASLAVSLVFCTSWLPTPSYNSLIFQALLITSIGLLLSDRNGSSRSMAGWVLIGVGGWLAFMAKPSSALALAIGTFAYIFIARKFSFRMILLAIVSASTLLLVSALLIDGSIYKFVDRLRTGIQFADYLGSSHTLKGIIRIDVFKLGAWEIFAILFLALATYIAIRSACSEKKSGKVLSILISTLSCCFVILWSLGTTSRITGFGQFQGMVIWGSIFPMMALGLLSGRKKVLTHSSLPADDFSIRFRETSDSISTCITHSTMNSKDCARRMFNGISAEHWSIALFFFIMPHIYAFGTNGNYWRSGCAVFVFWLLAGLVLLSPFVRIRGGWGFSIPLVLVTQAVSVTLLQTGLEQPYRQPQSLRLHDRSIEIGATGSNLVLSAGYAKYVEDAKNAAYRAGFKSGSSMIDLTGQSPGILYALRAESIGQPWTLGGYAGSLKFVMASLGRVPCEKIAAAWILYEPDGPRRIPVEAVLSQGADFSQHYRQVASWHTAEGAGGYAASRIQILYAPTAQQETLNACQILRRGEGS